jgi:hypothetical protein
MVPDEITGTLRETWTRLLEGAAGLIAALQTDTAAVWVQAIGSVLAIAVAIWIAGRQSRDTLHIERRRDA